jgi:hypothetical protein
VKTTRRISVSVSAAVAAVVSAPAVIDAWFALSVLSISAWKRLSWVSLNFRGPVRSQPAMSLMLAVSCVARSGTPRTNVTTTNASTPPSRARPPMSTSAVATPRGTCRTWSWCTAGASSAASSRAIATGTTTAATYDTTIPIT